MACAPERPGSSPDRDKVIGETEPRPDWKRTRRPLWGYLRGMHRPCEMSSGKRRHPSFAAQRARSSAGERSLHTREVGGSKPPVPITTKAPNCRLLSALVSFPSERADRQIQMVPPFPSPRSSGPLGRGALTRRTGCGDRASPSPPLHVDVRDGTPAPGLERFVPPAANRRPRRSARPSTGLRPRLEHRQPRSRR
jgi:hypothetical protein